MRKYLWGGVAMLVFGASAVYIAADHAAKHPNSFISRTSTAVAMLGVTGNPSAALQCFQHGPVVGEELAQGVCDPNEVEPPVQPPVVGDESPSQETEEPEQVIEVPQGNTVERMADHFNGVCPRYYDHARCEEDTGETRSYVMPMPVEEMPVMPEVTEDDEVIVPENLPVMPQEVRSFGNDDCDLLGDAQGSFVPRTDSITISMSGGMVFDAVSTTSLPRSCDPEVTSSWFQRMVDFVQGESATVGSEEACESDEAPSFHWLTRLPLIGKLFEPTATEPTTEIEPMTSGDEMQEETPVPTPNYHHHHYQGCPYSGCPYPHATMPPVYTPPETPPVTEESETKTTAPKKHKRRACGTSRVSFWQRLISGGCEDRDCQPNIDTMEARPTDIQFNLNRLFPF